MSAAKPAVALATFAAVPNLAPDDALLVPALAARGVKASAAVWEDPRVDWTAFDAVVIRSCWNYHLHAAAFFAWIDHLILAGVPLWNPPAVLRWNAEKTYLRELAARGVQIVPTRWIERGGATRLHEVLSTSGWDHAVVKPAVSASAYETWRTSMATAERDEIRFRALVCNGRVLVQPFVPAITTEGEWSLVFLGGVFSHAMLKRARVGDFRVQAEHGGTAARRDPGPHVIAQAAEALRAGPFGMDEILYARVDGCIIGGELLVMEVELLEPTLYLGHHPAAPHRFAAALLDHLRRA